MDASSETTDFSIELLAPPLKYKEPSDNTYLNQLMTDMWNNFKIVSIPSYFTNFTWRILNLYGIASDNEIGTLIWTTAVMIAPIVFVICTCIDLIRVRIEEGDENNRADQSLLREANTNINRDQNWYIGSIKLGIKFFLNVICWTIGYAIFNIYFSDPYSNSDLALRSLGAGIGSFLGLFLACLLVCSPSKVSLGVAVRGFFEGIVWSLLTDQDIYNFLLDGIGTDCAYFVNSLIVSIGASTTFTLASLVTTTSYYWLISRNKNSAQQKNERAHSSVLGIRLRTSKANFHSKVYTESTEETSITSNTLFN